MDSQGPDLYSCKKSNLVFGDNRSCISCRDKEGSVLLCEVLDCQVNLCPLMFNGDSFKLETCRSDNLWTGKFVYKKHFKEENCFSLINEGRNRALWADGATDTGAKKHKLIMGRFNLEINWSFLSAGWEAVVKWCLKPLWKSWIPGLSPSSAEAPFPTRVDPSPSASCQSYFMPSSLLEDGSKGVSLLLKPRLALTNSREQTLLSRKSWMRIMLPWNSWPWCWQLIRHRWFPTS